MKSDQEPERRHVVSLTDEQIEAIAEKAAQKAMAKLTNQFYQEVGKGVVSKFIWVMGVLAVAVYVWAQKEGYIK